MTGDSIEKDTNNKKAEKLVANSQKAPSDKKKHKGGSGSTLLKRHKSTELDNYLDDCEGQTIEPGQKRAR